MGLLSEDYGKHLLGVEDLLQKHSLVEADIAAQADRVQSVNEQAEVFLHQDNEQDGIEYYIDYILTILIKWMPQFKNLETNLQVFVWKI